MNSQVEEPFQYGYFGGWEAIISAFELLMFAVLAICIVIAPVFSGEYQSGTDAVILSGKYGKTNTDKKYLFDMERYMKRKPAIVKPDEPFEMYELTATDLQ